jgi:ABC-type antimicrobial peptide transport system permease subunit
VTRRTRELGIRLALGARRAGIFRVVIQETMTLVLAGVVVGLPLALAGGKLISARLFGVGASDPATLLGAAGLMVAVALVASCAPAYRATRVDPVIALRYE